MGENTETQEKKIKANGVKFSNKIAAIDAEVCVILCCLHHQIFKVKTVIFVTVFNHLLEKLEVESNCDYGLNGIKIFATPFPEHFNSITTYRSTHPIIINNLLC